MPYGILSKVRAEELAAMIATREPQYRFKVAPYEIIEASNVRRWGVQRWEPNYAPPTMPERLVGFVWWDDKTIRFDR